MKTGKHVCGKFKINLDPLNETKTKLKDETNLKKYFQKTLQHVFSYSFTHNIQISLSQGFQSFFFPATDAKYQ